MGDSFRRGALMGFLAWLVYGVVEYSADVLPRQLLHSDLVLSSWHWQANGAVVGAYAAFGLLLGGLGGVGAAALTKMLRRNEAELATRRLVSVNAVLTLVAAFLMNLASRFEGGLSGFPVLVLSAAMALALFICWWSDRLTVRWQFLTDFWTVSLVLVGTSVFVEMIARRAWLRSGAGVLLLTVAIAVARVADRRLLRPRWAELGSPRLSASFAVAGAVFFAVLGASLALSAQLDSRMAALQRFSGPSDRPNVALVVMDTVRARNLSLYDYSRKTTPNLEALAQHATVFTAATTTADMTLPGHASLFTGVYAGAHGTYCDPPQRPWGSPLPDEFETLAEVLARHGYSTLGVSANFSILKPEFGLQRGFQAFDAREPLSSRRIAEPDRLRTAAIQLLRRFVPGMQRKTRRAEEINRDVLPLLGTVARPWFVFVNYMDAHEPYLPPPPFDKLFPGKDTRLDEAKLRAARRQVLALERDLTEPESSHMVSQYDGAIAYIDSQIGGLVAHLEQLGLFDNTLLIITSDHGEALGEHSMVAHPVSTHQHQIRVPLLIRYPHQREGHVVDTPVSLVDIMPTVLAVLGYEIPDTVMGLSLTDPPPIAREVVSEFFPCVNVFDAHPRFRRRDRAIVSLGWKFITSTSGTSECYNLAADSDEEHNLYGTETQECTALEQRLGLWDDVLVRRGSSDPTRLDSELIERLRSLGYIH